mgnify:CR=1 FL=1
MKIVPYIEYFSEVVDKYDVFILDQWGVMHNGQKSYPSAIQCVEKLYNLKPKNLIRYGYGHLDNLLEKYFLDNLKKSRSLFALFTALIELIKVFLIFSIPRSLIPPLKPTPALLIRQ